ncbi:MAG TPA: DUF2721 domain-containing protein [Stellaceae bacterium]|nr:DUF2721 domain-containing protein [Stellaceae bacterium]
MNFVPNAAQLQAMFAQAAAPAFLLGGIAAFISILMSRITTLTGQIHAHGDGAKPKDPIAGLKRRIVLLHRAAYLALLAGIATTFLLIVMALFTFIGLQHIYGAGLLFGIAVTLFTLSLFNFAMEVRTALRELDPV